MRVAITGSSGLVGKQLTPWLTGRGHEVLRIVRRLPGEGEVGWDPESSRLRASDLEGLDAVVHLAGESIADGRWNDAKKRRICESRVTSTLLLCNILAQLERPPRVLVSASAVGFYGERGAEELDEASTAGSGFLADVCRQWEEATRPAEQAGLRVVHSRFGMVLSPRGGALQKMLLPFKLGAGGRVGSGKQYWSWIALGDLVGALHHCLADDTLQGPVNVVAPNPVTNLEFTKALGRSLSRPTVIPLPAFAARLMLGEMADALLLTSTRALPKRLLETGFEFKRPILGDALTHLLDPSSQDDGPGHGFANGRAGSE